MSLTISSLLIDCVRSLSRLIASVELKPYDSEVRKDLWEDEMGRLRVWAANIGAHQTGQSSLDFRLRDSSHVKDQTVRLLEALQRTLANIDEVLAEPAPEDDLGPHPDEATEIQQLYKALVKTVNCLFQMSIMIRRPARHDRFLGTKRADVAGFEPFDRQHVSDKYPHADGEITGRLGAGISRRRATLKYRGKHHEKMKKGINRILGDQPDTASTNLSETVATEYVAPDPIFEDTASISGISQTSYAQTLLSGQDSMTIPSLPKDSANESPFECPYCYFTITIKNQRSWARHIFNDIMPYICVYSNCSTPNRLYESRREWFYHLQNAHSVGIDPAAKQDCPLCRKIIASGILFQKHLERHLEELALFAMPRTAEDDDDQDSAYTLEQSHSDPNEVDEDIGDISAEDYGHEENIVDRTELERDIIRDAVMQTRKERKAEIEPYRLMKDALVKTGCETEEELKNWTKARFFAYGYTEQQVEDIFNGDVVAPRHAESVRVHSDNIHPEVLDIFNIRWEWNEPRSSRGWIIVNHVTQGMFDQLMDHTRLQQRRCVEASKVNELEKDQIG